MKISIITVCFNNEDTIEDTINSVLSQTYQNFEYLIIDGASTDNTLNIVNRYLNDKRIKLISEKDNGIYDAMNKGISKAEGDIVGIINSDDILAYKGVFRDVVDCYDTDTQVLYADVLYCNYELNKIHRKYISGENKSITWCPAHPSMYVRKEVFNEVGVYDLQFKICADYDFMIRCNLNNLKFTYLKKYIVKMRTGGASNGLKGYYDNFIDCYKILKKYKIGFPFFRVVIKSIKTIIQIIKH